MSAKVTFDLDTRTAIVSGGVTEQHARKLLQDKLKSETPFRGGWECFLLNRKYSSFGRSDAQKTVSVEEDYMFELYNPFASMAGYI